jgi:hypothetical protein
MGFISSWIKRGACFQALAGGAVWLTLSLLLFADAGIMGRVHTLLLLAALVLVPLALALIAAPKPDPEGRHPLPYRAAVIVHPIAAAALSASFFFPPGLTAAAIASPWALFTGLAALFGLWRLFSRGIAGARSSSDRPSPSPSRWRSPVTTASASSSTRSRSTSPAWLACTAGPTRPSPSSASWPGMRRPGERNQIKLVVNPVVIQSPTEDPCD